MMLRLSALYLLFSLLALPVFSLPLQKEPEALVPQECLVIFPVGRYGRNPIQTDALVAQRVAGTWKTPKAGDTVMLPEGKKQTWETLKIGADGSFQHPALQGGYACMTVNSPAAQVWILEASGPSMTYVNGVPRTGDPYQYGMTRLPVTLQKGENVLLMPCGRGSLRVRLSLPKSPALFNTADPTLPDLVVGQKTAVWGAVIVVNATDAPMLGLSLMATGENGARTATSLPEILPLGTRKVAFRLPASVPAKPGMAKIALSLLGKQKGAALDTASLTLRVRKPEESRKITFFSKIDGSLQYYGLVLAQPLTREVPPPAFVLTLHGASVEGIGQAEAYAPKTWAHLVAPTNRRPFGFDWEDWGRQDALEVLELAQKALRYDPRRVYLTGHSMGGHGTWQLGATFPDKFAAIAPSAGWISFFSYAGGSRVPNPDPLLAMVQRAANPSDTLALAKNYAQEGVYILHGDADDNVPVTEARTMRDHLRTFHTDLGYYEQPGAGHWWGASDEPGTSCVDWPPIFDMFTRRSLPTEESIRQVDFVTANPTISASCHWVTIETQEHPLVLSSVSLRYDPMLRRFVGKTENVATLSLSLEHVRLGGAITAEIDNQKITLADAKPKEKISLSRTGGKWAVTAAPSPLGKNPRRSGPFKEAFRNHMLFVYGTQGDLEENALLFAKARYDAETFWYRGNGAVDVVADTKFDAIKEKDRNVVLYGNADTNAAWKALLSESPVQVHREGVRVGQKQFSGADLACLFLRPRPGSEIASVAVVSGTGSAGIRLTERLPYFLSGAAFPDLTVFSAESLLRGAEGVRAAGFFGNDWSVEKGEFAYHP